MSETKYRYLVQQYKNRIYTYALYMVRNRMDADDITQEVLIKIWKGIEGVNFLSASSWIIRTTHNQCIDVLRKRGVELRREAVIDEVFEETYEGRRTENDPYIKYQLKHMSERIKEAVQRLPENLRSVFVLYEMQDLKYSEIAEALDIPLNSVKVYLLRARRKLQEELKKKDISGVLNYE
jgi:RNA polymerase sigma-70 factor (ECF subfamily)